MSQHYRATVRIMRGVRGVNEVMRAAFPDISGVGIWEEMKITYKPGEVVTKERMETTLRKMKEISDVEHTEFEILDWEVLEIVIIPE